MIAARRISRATHTAVDTQSPLHDTPNDIVMSVQGRDYALQAPTGDHIVLATQRALTYARHLFRHDIPAAEPRDLTKTLSCKLSKINATEKPERSYTCSQANKSHYPCHHTRPMSDAPIQPPNLGAAGQGRTRVRCHNTAQSGPNELIMVRKQMDSHYLYHHTRPMPDAPNNLQNSGAAGREENTRKYLRKRTLVIHATPG